MSGLLHEGPIWDKSVEGVPKKRVSSLLQPHSWRALPGSTARVSAALPGTQGVPRTDQTEWARRRARCGAATKSPPSVPPKASRRRWWSLRPEAAEVTPEVPARAQRLSRRPPRAQTRLVDSFRLSFTVVIGRLSTSGPPIQLAGLRSQEPRWWRLDIPTITQDSL